ncbi:hypothetical protein ON010_g6330 [Phytophthora cinnamomi]|nr:hypothetical protein ON010_g6330 [Phytophthora cinnamomi]
MLVRENQWAELCSEEERQEAGSAVLCAAQEVRLQYVFSTGFLCLSAANAFFGVFLDMVGPRVTIMLGLTLSALGNFALAFGDSHTGDGAWIIAPIGLVDGMREELKRQDLWFFALLFGWVSLIFAFAGGAIPSLLTKLAGDDTHAASLFTDILYPILVNGTFGYSPIVGYVIDHYGFKVIFVACIALVQIFIALLLIPSLRVQLVMFFVYAMAQTCLYALQFAYIIMCFPAELYGTLQAFLATVSFSFGLLNYVINPWTQIYFDGSYTVALLFLGLPTILFYGFIHVVQGCEHHTVSHKTRAESAARDSLTEENTRLL